MKNAIKTAVKALSVPLVLVLVLVLSGTVMAAEDNLKIQVSPNVINLSSNGGSFSIHAEISYSLVEEENLGITVNDEPILELTTFADDRGELVVKCEIDYIKELLETGEATFILTVDTADGEFSGEDTVRVIECGK